MVTIGLINNTNLTNYDMASALEVLRTYAGEKNDDPFEWLSSIKMVKKIFTFDHDTIKTIFTLKLRGNAQIWASHLILSCENISYDDLILEFTNRFDNSNIKYRRFADSLWQKLQITEKNLKKLLREANSMNETKRSLRNLYWNYV